MKNVRRRLQVLERLPQLPAPPSVREQITSLALQSLSAQDFELLRDISLAQATGIGYRELSEGEAVARAAWEAALETEARRGGFSSFAEAERTAGQRR